MRACLAASAFIEGPPVLVSSAAQPHESGWSPSAVVASGTRGEHARWPIGVADEPPRFASESLIERMGMADLGRNRRPAMCTEGTKGAVAFGSKGTAPSRHRRTSLAFPLAPGPQTGNTATGPWSLPELGLAPPESPTYDPVLVGDPVVATGSRSFCLSY